MTENTSESKNPAEAILGAPIYTYTADQALGDGVLVHASKRTHPNYLFSAAVFHAIMELSDLAGEDPYSLKYEQRVVPLLMDVGMIAMSPEFAGDSMYTGHGLDGNLLGTTLWFGLNEKPGGLTIMFPEDY